MKKIDTEYVSNKKANLVEIKIIIDNLFTEEDSEYWLCLFDTSKHNLNYIQINSDIEGYEDDALEFLQKTLSISLEQFDELEKIYLVEYRHHEDEDNFKHYRAFFTDTASVYNYFEKYMHDEAIDIAGWLDVTEEFEED